MKYVASLLRVAFERVTGNAARRNRNRQRTSRRLVLYLRSALFLIWFIVVSVVMHIVCLPTLLLDRKAAAARAAHLGAARAVGLARDCCGSATKCAGASISSMAACWSPPSIICMWETIALLVLLDDPAIVIKRELLRVPLYGWYARKQEMIAIDRKAGATAMRAMLAAARDARLPMAARS